MNKYLKENLTKNIIVVLLAVLSYPPLKADLGQISGGQDMNNLLVILSMLIMTVSFANFAFTYEKSDLKSTSSRYFGHISTAIYLLLTALLLESLVILVATIYPSLQIVFIVFTVLMYVGVIMYDFWDLFRSNAVKNQL